eukprot:226383-Prorocentrum_lima.AAC.1
MHSILAAAGVAPKVLKLIPQIIGTCKMRRQFTTPAPRSAATSRLTTSFNQIVQHDLLFVDSHVEQSRVETSAS